MTIQSSTAAQFMSVAEQFEYIFARYHQWVRGRLFARLGDWHLADDLAEDTFADLWREMSQGTVALEAIENLYGYLAVRARWEITRHFARLAVQREQPCEQLPEDAGSTETPADAVADRAQVGQLLAMLPERQRRAVTLHLMQGLSRREVAQRTGYALETTKQHVREGLAALREAAGVQARPCRESTEARDAQARAVFLAAAAAGSAMTGKALAAQFGMSESWASRILAETGYQRPASVQSRIMADLTEQIASPQAQAGAALPRVTDISRRFGVEPASVSSTLRVMERRGQVRRSEGRWYATPSTHGTAVRQAA